MEKNHKHVRERLESEPQRRVRKRDINYTECKKNIKQDKATGRTNQYTSQ